MNENTHEYDVFYKPDAPRSDWECFKWAFVEPSLLREYSDTLSKKQIFLQLLRIYVKFIIPLFIGLLLAFAFLSAFYNLPTLFPIIYKEKFLILWMQKINFQERFIFCFCFLYDNLNYVLLGILFAPVAPIASP